MFWHQPPSSQQNLWPPRYRHKRSSCCSACWFSALSNVDKSRSCQVSVTLGYILDDIFSWGSCAPPTSNPRANMEMVQGWSTHSWLLNHTGLNCTGLHYMRSPFFYFFLPVNMQVQVTLGIPVSHPQIEPISLENSIFHLGLGIHRCRGPAVRTVVCHFM